MALVTFVERALEGRCAICGRRLPKRPIPLYTAHANLWSKTEGQDCREVQVCVCGDRCMRRYNDDEDKA